MKNWLLIALLTSVATVFGQSKSLPMHVFYKDHLMRHTRGNSLTTFFPANETQLPLHHLIRDSSKQYYELTNWLFKKHWVEVKDQNGHLFISPLVDITLGKEQIDTTRTTLFRNTRGVYAEGQLGKKLSFQFVFAENQARFRAYESQYIAERGEIRIGANGYYTENGTVPGAARTKPFKIGAYDYAYSMGSVNYQINPKMRVEIGNTPQFVGAGYRSLLLSDNALPAMGVRYSWKIGSRWEYHVVWKQHKNQYRKPVTQAVESAYENKLFTASYLTFKPHASWSVSLFSGGNQLRADSLIQHPLQAQMLVPIPLASTDLIAGNQQIINGIAGLNIDWAGKRHHVYAQVAVDRYRETFFFAGQLGTYFLEVWNNPGLFAQLEFNLMPRYFYAAPNPKLAYSTNNLPSAHPKGNNFFEAFYRIQYEKKRWFIQSKSIVQATQAHLTLSPFESHSIFLPYDQTFYFGKTYSVHLQQELEVGYRFNRKYNGTISALFQYREHTGGGIAKSFFLGIGLKSGLFNQYFDF